MFYQLKLIFLLGLVCCIHNSASAARKTGRHDVRKFPDNFLFGSATSSYQIEGAWDEDGKAESIWDRLTHTRPETIKDQSTGDIATDSYHLYKRDVEMMRELGLDFYRFSLSWPRILPTSFPDMINQAGVDYYNNLINEMLKYNIEPMITLYHWDLPQKLQDMGGWTNPYIVDWYADYARVAFELFGDRVKYWITMNEPDVVCYYSYGQEYMAPRINIGGIAEYMCAKHLLLAHAKAYHIYDKEFRPSQKGSIFITLSSQWYEPETEEDADAAEAQIQFDTGHYAHPIFSKTGDWPAVMKNSIDTKSAEQGFLRSRLPAFTPEEVDYVRGTSDYFGLNHYTTFMVSQNVSAANYKVPSHEDDLGIVRYTLEEYYYNEPTFNAPVPWGFHKLLLKIKDMYDNPAVFVTENGFANNGGLSDDDRVTFYRSYLDAMLDAIDDGCDVRAYTAWSIMDNFEWVEGYIERFGLYEVDFESPERMRTARKSAFVYKEIIRTRALDWHYEPDITTMTIDEGH